MSSEMSTIITLVSASGVLSLFILLYIIIRRHNFRSIAKPFILYIACVIIYCFGSAFALLSTTFEQMQIWTVIQYLGIPFIPPLGLLFVMHYIGIDITKKRRSLTLFVIPIITLFLVATNSHHNLFYRVYELDPVLGAPFYYFEMGIWYLIQGIFTFSCTLAAIFILIAYWKETSKEYRPQLIALIGGQLIPLVTLFLYALGITPPGIDPVPLVLSVTSLLYLWSITTSGLFNVMPIAKDAIFNSINDGVLVLDGSFRMIEYNQASKKMLQGLSKEMYGMKFEEVWFNLSGSEFPFQLENVAFNEEIRLATVENGERIYQVRTALMQQERNRKGLLIIFTDITDLKRLQEKLEHLAYYDELTKVFNRRAFFQRCEEDFSMAKADGVPFTVLIIDIDYFKRVNDTYGHHVGDQVLTHVVNVFKLLLKDDALLARYGGEEFVIALKGQTAVDGEAIGWKICNYLFAHPFLTAEGEIPVTVSCGVAELEGPKETLYQLLNKADKALYAAKDEGRNRVHVYDAHEGIY